MTTIRKRPAVGMTLDRDVVEWINAQAAARRLKPSQFVNSVLAERMTQDKPAISANDHHKKTVKHR